MGYDVDTIDEILCLNNIDTLGSFFVIKYTLKVWLLNTLCTVRNVYM